AVVLHHAADRQEARGQLALRCCAGAAAGGLHTCRRGRDQFLVDLRLVLAGDGLEVRLVQPFLRPDAGRAVIGPPVLALEWLAILVDQGSGRVRPSRGPKQLPALIQHLEGQEGAAEPHARGELVPDLAVERDPGPQDAVSGADITQAQAYSLRGREIQHRLLAADQGIHAAGYQHRVLGADAQYIRKLLRNIDEEDVEADQRVERETVAQRQVDVLRSQVVLRLREGAVFL